jgi:hypothetical protein
MNLEYKTHPYSWESFSILLTNPPLERGNKGVCNCFTNFNKSVITIKKPDIERNYSISSGQTKSLFENAYTAPSSHGFTFA